MAATIINITGADNAANIAGVGNMAARVLAIGSSWTDIRLGWRWTIEDTGANITFTGAGDQTMVGVMASPTANLSNGPLTATTSNFLGFKEISGTFVRATGPIRYENIANQVCLRSGNTNTLVAGGATYMVGTGSLRVGYLLRITKGGVNWTVERTFPSYNANGAALADISIDGLLTAMKSPNLADSVTRLNEAAGGAGTRYSSASQTIANATVNEAGNGFFNAIVFGWGKLTGLRFSEMAFVQIS